MSEIRQRDVPEQLVLTEQRSVRVGELPDWLGAAMGRLAAEAERHGGVAGSAFVVFHGKVDEEHDGPVEVCVPVDQAQEGAADVATRREPAHREAYVRLRKEQVAFPEILSAYEAVDRWIGAQGLAVAGAPREVYFTDFGAADPGDEVCDVAFPIC